MTDHFYTHFDHNIACTYHYLAMPMQLLQSLVSLSLPILKFIYIFYQEPILDIGLVLQTITDYQRL